jgi:hypothetical protein
VGLYRQALQGSASRAGNRDIFTAKDFDNFLLSDKENYRVLPYNTGAPGNWAYYHQTLNGYTAAKLKRYDDVLNRKSCPNTIASGRSGTSMDRKHPPLCTTC